MDYKDISKEYQGVTDINLAISLFEYGLIYKEDPDGAFSFIYGVSVDDDTLMYNRFSSISGLDPNNFESEYDWADYEDVANSCGITLKEWNQLPYPYKVWDLFHMHGYENVFGTSYPEEMLNIPEEYIS